MCNAGARWVRSEILQKYPASAVRVYVVWFDVLAGDSRQLVDTRVLNDPRVTNYYDGKGVVTGTVSDSGGAPAADAEVSAFPAGTVVDSSTVAVATTFSAPAGLTSAPEGSYAMHLDPATYDLYVRAQGVTDRTLAASGVVVTSGAITTRDLTLP